jgi:hypothetical protein
LGAARNRAEPGAGARHRRSELRELGCIVTRELGREREKGEARGVGGQGGAAGAGGRRPQGRAPWGTRERSAVRAVGRRNGKDQGRARDRGRGARRPAMEAGAGKRQRIKRKKKSRT